MNVRARTCPEGRPHVDRRRGYTLIQMLAVIATAGVLMGVGGSALSTLLRSQSGAQEHLRLLRLRSRLARVFREDVHAAASATAIADGIVLLREDRPPIRYGFGPRGLLRQEGDPKTPVSQEFFPLDGWSGAINLDGARVWLRLKSTASHAAEREFAVLAIVARDIRFETKGGMP